MLPTTVCATIQSFLHRVNQHYISALSSIDTFQSISASIDQSTMEMLVPSSLSLSMHSSNDDDHAAAAADNDDGSAINNDKNDNARKKKNVIDEFNLNDDIYDDDDKDEGDKEDIKYTSHLIEEALKLPGSSLFIMAGSSAYQRVLHNNSSSSRSTNDDHHDHNHRESIYSSNKILLSYMTGRLLMHLSISYVYYLYRTILRDIVTTATTTTTTTTTTTKSTPTTTTTASQAVHHSLKNDVDGDATITPEDAIVNVNVNGGEDDGEDDGDEDVNVDGDGDDGGDSGCSLLNTAVLEEPSLQVIFDLHVLGIYLSMYIYLSIYLSIYRSIYHLSIDLSIHPSIHISKHHIDLSLLIISYHTISYHTRYPRSSMDDG